jgi:hypothetical protein
VLSADEMISIKFDHKLEFAAEIARDFKIKWQPWVLRLQAEVGTSGIYDDSYSPRTQEKLMVVRSLLDEATLALDTDPMPPFEWIEGLVECAEIIRSSCHGLASRQVPWV